MRCKPPKWPAVAHLPAPFSDGAISDRSFTSDRSVMSDNTLTAGRGAAVATMREPAQEITIRAIASSWVEVVRGDGTTVLKKLMRAGDIYIVDDSSGLYLSTVTLAVLKSCPAKMRSLRLDLLVRLCAICRLPKTGCATVSSRNTLSWSF